MPRKTTPLNAAKQITNVLEKMKDVPYDRSDFIKHYIEKSTQEKSPKYRTEIAKCLKENNCFTNRGNRIILTKIPSIDVLNCSIEKALKTRKGLVKKTPQLKYSVNNNIASASESNLIPKKNFLDSISTKEIVNYLLNDRKIIIANNEIYAPV